MISAAQPELGLHRVAERCQGLQPGTNVLPAAVGLKFAIEFPSSPRRVYYRAPKSTVAMSVWTKSSPLNSRGSSFRNASAYEKQSP